MDGLVVELISVSAKLCGFAGWRVVGCRSRARYPKSRAQSPSMPHQLPAKSVPYPVSKRRLSDIG
jgi:hypothetical protein